MLEKLETMNLADNKLGGNDRPHVLAMLPNLRDVNISHNQIQGELNEFAKSSSLRTFDLCKLVVVREHSLILW
jgi:Leucine-rich repeat (LRR) protein